MFHLTMTTGNDAFQADVSREIARILRAAADKIENGQHDGKLMDANGNSVGSYGHE